MLVLLRHHLLYADSHTDGHEGEPTEYDDGPLLVREWFPVPPRVQEGEHPRLWLCRRSGGIRAEDGAGAEGSRQFAVGTVSDCRHAYRVLGAGGEIVHGKGGLDACVNLRGEHHIRFGWVLTQTLTIQEDKLRNKTDHKQKIRYKNSMPISMQFYVYIIDFNK